MMVRHITKLFLSKQRQVMAIIPLLTDKTPFTISFKVFPQKKGNTFGVKKIKT